LVWKDVVDKYHGAVSLPVAMADNRPAYLLLNPIRSYMTAMRGATDDYELLRRVAHDGRKEASLEEDFTEAYIREYYLFRRRD
jgi:hypothetical protein